MKYKPTNPLYNKSKVSPTLRAGVYHRAKDMCEYVDKSGRCRKTTGLTIHHKIPRSNNGNNSTKNLILLCAFHRKLKHGIVKLDEDGIRIKQKKAKYLRLKNIARDFTKGLLDNKTSNRMCLAVCMPLASYLNLYGYNCKITEGKVNGLEHFWITLPDNTIIDATADQFKKLDGTPMPKVYVGSKPEWYTVL